MPFIDDDKLAALYKEIDQEKKSAAFFQSLHLQNKARLGHLRFYKRSFLIALMLIGAFFIHGIFDASNTPSVTVSRQENEILLKKIEQLTLENKILGGSTENIQSALKEVMVYTVQIKALSNKDIMLFSNHFVNFRAHSLIDFNAYSLGNFSTEQEAEAFRQELIKIGLTDVWVTAYKSDKRILLNK